MKLSVVIPTRNEFTNLKFTVQSLIDTLDPAMDDDYEIICGFNLADNKDFEYFAKLWWTGAGRVKVLRYDEGPSCWQTRQRCAEKAQGDYIFWCDSHVIVRGDDLVRAIKWHEGWKGTLKFGLNYMLDAPFRTLYQYKWRPEKFWGDWSRELPSPPDYRIMASGTHGLIDRDVFFDIGGLHSALGIYGGGEPYLDFKTHMFGYEIRCKPEFQVWHLAEKRGYSWNQQDFWRNFMIASYAIGGDEALEPLYATYFEKCKDNDDWLANLYKLKDEAIMLASHDRQWIEQNASISYQQVLREFGHE